MTLDKNKNLWVAHFHGACVSVFNIRAKLIHRIHLPAKNITNCTFGGLKNNEIFIMKEFLLSFLERMLDI